MKKLAIFISTLLLGASLSFAQQTGGSTDSKVKTTTGKKGAKTKTKTKGKKGADPALNPQPLPPRMLPKDTTTGKTDSPSIPK